MKLCRLFAVVFLVFLMCGCSAVYVPEPVGEEAVVLDDSWSGAWRFDDGVLHTGVTNSETGLLSAAWIEDGGDKLKLESHAVHVRDYNGHRFASVKDAESDYGFLWMVFKKSENVIVIWMADADRFKALISEGKLEGRILNPDNPLDDNVVMKGLPPDLLDKIVEPSEDLLLWEDPIVLTRLVD